MIGMLRLLFLVGYLLGALSGCDSARSFSGASCSAGTALVLLAIYLSTKTLTSAVDGIAALTNNRLRYSIAPSCKKI